MPILRSLPTLVPTLVLTLACTLAGQDFRPQSVPVRVAAEIDAAPLATAGRATLRLTFTPEVVPERPLAVRVELRAGGRMFLRRDHAPPTPCTQWPVGKPFTYELPLAFAIAPKLAAGARVEVLVAWLDPVEDKLLAPLAREVGGDGLALVAEFTFPDLTGTPDATAVDAVIAAALELAPKQPQVAWDQLEFTFRRLDDYPQKQKLQKALATVGRMAPAALGFEEQDIVRGRIGDERARYLRQVAGRMFDAGKLLGAYALLAAVGGSLQEQADRAVLGALADAKRVTQDRDGIAAKVFDLTKEQQDEVAALAEKHAGKERLELGSKLAKDPGKRAVGRELVRTLEFTPELRAVAAAVREQIEKAWLADVPAEQQAEVDAALQHPCWARTTTRLSHRFVLIGPKVLLDGIAADSLLRFDLAYLYLTDLFGRVPNPDGDRVTVYFKELWDFGGGIGGGKIIDVGRANPAEKAARVDTGLFFHELTHCVDDTTPIYGGFREGLADFGATFAAMELGQIAAARANIGLAARAFLQDYLDRDLEYWRIPNYAPSAGFFLHFITQYGKQGDQYQWQRYRRFFRDYRDSPVKDGRTPQVARAFAYHLVQAFGEAALADLMRFRWPLVPADLKAIALEQKSAARPAVAVPDLDEAPGSPVPRDQMARRLQREGAGLADHALELGIVKDWWVIGPFKKEGVDADSFRFPPELEIDLQARYASINNNPTWRQPGNKPVTVDDTGWLNFDFSYQDWSAIYALTHIDVASATEAWFHLRADDDATLFVDDELVGKYDNAGGPLGPWRPHWQVQLPDAITFRVQLHAGRNKVLVKVHNRTGPSGLTLAIAQRNGLPLTNWRSDLEPPKQKLAAIEVPDAKRWPKRLDLDFKGSATHRKLDTPVGQWRVRNQALEGFASDRQVEWRKYTVRPGFPKDSPSNLCWLPEKATDSVDAFAFTLELPPASPAPKLCVITEGDGQRDALSGWTLIVEPHGDGVHAFLERYDQRIYDSGPVAWKSDAKKSSSLTLVHWARRLTVKLDDKVLFDQAPLLPIPGKTRIGVATWGEALRIEALELRAPARTR